MYIKEFNVIYTEKKTDEYRLYICKKSLENQLYRIFELADRNKITEYIKYFNSLNFKDFYGDFSIDEKYYIVTDRWQTFTNVELNTDILEKLSGYCDEFLVHGVDVEGKASGIEEELIKILEQAEIPVTYAGGIGSLDDLERIRKIGNGKIDFTIGSALDLFGGKIQYDVIKNYR